MRAFILLCSFCLLSMIQPAHAEVVKIMRIGDSITRMASGDDTLAKRLQEAQIDFEFVGTQKPVKEPVEAYNGKRIEFFTTRQDSYGQETIIENEVPLEHALETYQPDILLVMLGVNNLGQSSEAKITTDDLRAKLDEFFDAMEGGMKESAQVIVATVTPADNSGGRRGKPDENRNERHQLYNAEVLRPAVEARIASGKPTISWKPRRPSPRANSRMSCTPT